MKTSVVVSVVLAVLLVATGCQKHQTDSPDVTVDPPEAFYPHETVILHQSVEFGGLRIDVESVGASVGKDIRDINLTVNVVYVNRGSEALNPPTDVKFAYGFHPYPAAPTGQIKLADGQYVDGPIPAGGSAEGAISGTLVGVAHSDPPSGDEMRDIVTKAALMFGQGSTQVTVPFEEKPG